MKKLLISALLLAGVTTACIDKAPVARKTYLYCAVDTTWQSLPSYQVENSLFPDSKFNSRRDYTDAKYENGMALIEVELTKPTYIMVMPSRDSTVSITWSGCLLLMPGDSLELTAVEDAQIPGFKCLRPELVETARKDNACQKQFDARFSFKTNPKVVDNNLVKYRADWDSVRLLEIAFLDSCRTAMPLSDEYYRLSLATIDASMFNSLCSGLKKAEAQRPAGYLDGLEISDMLAGTSIYTYSMLGKYIKYAVAEPEKNFDAVYAGIRKAPRKVRDYLMAMMIGYYAEQQLPSYEQPLSDLIARAETSIRDTAYLSYIGRAKEFYFRRNMPFPDDALQQTFVRTMDSDAKLSLGDLLKQFEGQPVYIDFWASWCCGCIMDIQQSKNGKELLAGAGVAYLYFSIDKDAEAWIKSARENNVTTNSYLCFGERDSAMSKFLGIREIPRYILLDKDHKIVSMDAPRPTDYSLEELKSLVETLGPTIVVCK